MRLKKEGTEHYHNYSKRTRTKTKQATKLNKKLVDRGKGKGKRRSKRWLQRMRPNLEHCIHFFVPCQGKEITACTRSPAGTKEGVESIQPGGVPSTESVDLFTNQPTPFDVKRRQRSFLVEFRCCNKLIPIYYIDPSECFILDNLEFALVGVCCLCECKWCVCEKGFDKCFV